MNLFNTRVDQLPLHKDSAQLVANVGGGTRLHFDAGSALYNGDKIGIPVTRFRTRAYARWTTFSFLYNDESDQGLYPIGEIESANDKRTTIDHHMIVIIEDEGRCYEVFQTDLAQGTAGSGAIWDMGSDKQRAWGWTSAAASGYPIYKGLVTYDEVARGRIDHAIRMTVEKTYSNKNGASHKTSGMLDSVPSPQLQPALGERYRLRADFDISGYGAQARVVLQALKEYGAYVCDNGGNWFLGGVPDARWDDEQFGELPFGSAMEVVDCASWGLQRGSYAVAHQDPKPRESDVIARLTATITDQKEQIIYLTALLNDYRNATSGITNGLRFFIREVM